MKNLLWCVIPTIILAIISGVTAIVLLIRNFKKLWIISVIFFIFLGTGIFSIYPFIKDINKKELIYINGIYNKYIGTDGNWGCVKIGFLEGNKQVYIYISRVLFSKYDLIKDKKYKIRYYKNSHAVYDIELISE